MKSLHIAAFLLVVVGAINIGLMALINLDIIGSILGSVPSLLKLLNLLIGVSGVYLLVSHKDGCKICGKK